MQSKDGWKVSLFVDLFMPRFLAATNFYNRSHLRREAKDKFTLWTDRILVLEILLFIILREVQSFIRFHYFVSSYYSLYYVN